MIEIISVLVQVATAAVLTMTAALIVMGVFVSMGWFDRITEKIARFMFPGMYRATDSMREMNDDLRAHLTAMGVDVEAELKKLEEAEDE